MARRPTIADLAVEAGVSVATVDRVLNGRHRVREETARRVYEAANAIGYHATSLIRQRLQKDLPEYRLGFVLQKPSQFFYQSFAREIEAAVNEAPGIRGSALIDYAPSQTPTDTVAKLYEVAARCQAVAMAGPDHPTLTAAIQDLRERNIPVFSVFSDFASGVREGYVGTNNRMVGRTAAWLIAKTAKRPGKVAVFVGSHRFHGHEMREIGFRAYFREHAPQFQVLDTLVNLETRQITHEATIDLLQRHPDLSGLYIAGGGMEGAIAALREEGKAGKIIAVVNEKTPESTAGLVEEVLTAVISTPLQPLSRDLVARMVRSIETGAADAPGQTFIPFEICISENV
ncbi:LacI family DNA-binding transcriptional regulator [Mariluticola halotolerans]|uniref:LacI family DNA-binding transcriptional regulator n=1 Tax=Mariluticola halotolerans TaxID=2909283 RepID=UPI0026E1C8ED|nr:LacI family DNA-binding transcriptional regulator [Mariluticola halotolerans]UJQ92989.1 LacI family DNA-binding transcriptional regulator [Mariluticola halotolerans]